ncbi:hypothetical protein BKA81DRAFT_196640 [Phyllosticta paracitricarpa]|uniref:NWD NACHT-NTPase N-terminal domain-containing protein n=2 Tax=Phyllosticta TaxID=121621 RepID=A0ABR1LBI4_9PEZI
MSSDWESLRRHHSLFGCCVRRLFHHDCKHVRHDRRQSGSVQELATTKSPEFSASIQENVTLANGGSKTDESKIDGSKADYPKTTNFWNQAYEGLKTTQKDLVIGFEEIISDQSRPKEQNSDVGRDRPASEHSENINSQLSRVIDRKLKELEHLKWQDGLPGGVQNAVKVAKTVSGIVAKAVEKSSEASLAWSAITLCLPLLTSLGESATKFHTGLGYIAARMEYFAALGRTVSEIKLSEPEKLRNSSLELQVLELYTSVLEFQLHSVCRLHRNRILNATRDMADWDNWADRLSSIQEKEAKVRTVADSLGWDISREYLSEINEKLDDYFYQLLDIGKQQLEATKELGIAASKSLQVSLTKEQRECLSTFAKVDYEGYKSAVPDRIPGTCEWFEDDPQFHHWLDKKSRFLMISAGPGCGKSVLAKYLIESVLPTRAKGATICYFFFRDGQKETIDSASALCALVHQLLTAKPELVNYAMDAFNSRGETLAAQSTALWNIIQAATADENCEDVIFVFDALDECGDDSRGDLQSKLQQHFQSSQNTSRVRFLCTSRHYDEIVSYFEFPGASAIKYDESHKIGEDVKRVISHKVKELKLKSDLSRYLEDRLLEVENHTYLWVHLIFDFLNPPPGQHIEPLKRSKSGIDERLENLPKTVYDAYEKLLSRSTNQAKLRKALCIILAADRIPTVSDMNVAMEVEETMTCLDCEDDESFEKRLRSWSGLFISIIGKRVYLLHQTAREFLLREDGAIPSSLWRHSISEEQAYRVILTSVVDYCPHMADHAEQYPKDSFLHRGGLFFYQSFLCHWPYPLSMQGKGPEAKETIATLRKLSTRVNDKVLPRLPKDYPWIDCIDTFPENTLHRSMFLSTYSLQHFLKRLLWEEFLPVSYEGDLNDQNSYVQVTQECGMNEEELQELLRD